MNAATRRGIRQATALHDENRPHTRITRSKLTAKEITTTTAALPSKVGNNPVATRKRAALGDVTNAHKKPAHGELTNAVLKKETTITTTEKGVTLKRAVSRKTSIINVTKPVETGKTKSTNVVPVKHIVASVVIPKKRPSAEVVITAPAPRRGLTQSLSSTSLASKQNAKAATRHQIEEPVESEVPRKKQKIEKKQDWDDLDAIDTNDPQMVSEYVKEIFDYMRELEVKTMPNPSYMRDQTHLEWRMRGILVDWLIEVHSRFRMFPETLYLCVNLVDRFLSARPTSVEKLQLVGVTALLIASKYEEVMAPTLENFCYVADGGYTEQEIKRAERYLLNVVRFDLSYPNPMNFLRRISKADEYNVHSRTIAKYLIEISLVDDRFLKYTPSIVAGAGMYLARKMMGRGPWDANLVHYSGYTAIELRPVVQLMIDYLARKEILHDAFFKKYAAKKFMKASLLVREWIRDEYSAEVLYGLRLLESAKQEEQDQENIPVEEEREENVDDEDEEENKNQGSDVDDYMYANELEDYDDVDG